MSAPDHALQNLNLDEMPVTRSHARSSRGGRGGRGKERNPTASARMDPLSRHISQTAGSSRQGVRTSQRPVSSDLPRANRVIRVTHYGMSIGFQVQPAPLPPGVAGPTAPDSFAPSLPSTRNSAPVRVTVRMHYDTIMGYHRATCTCGMPSALCFHTYWLIDRLNREVLNTPAIDATLVRAQIAELYPRILDMSEASLRGLVNYSTEHDSEDEDEDKSRAQNPEAGDFVWPSTMNTRQDSARQYSLCDVLSSFDKFRTPEELQHDAVNQSQAFASRTTDLVEGDLHATLYRVAMRHRQTYETLQGLMSLEARTQKYYETQWSRIIGALEDPSISVPGCATILRNIVHQVYEDRRVRMSPRDQDASSKLSELLAGFLTRMVRTVVDEGKKGDQSDRMEGSAAFSSNQPAKGRDVYAYLISDRPEPESYMPEKMTNLFVVGRFGDLDSSQWSHTRDEWSAIMADIRSDETAVTVDEGEYADKIQEMLFIINGTDDPSDFARLHRMPRYHHGTTEQD